MDNRVLPEAAAVVFVSLLSFASPAAATWLGALAAGPLGGVIGWLASGAFVLMVLFPALGTIIDRIERNALDH